MNDSWGLWDIAVYLVLTELCLAILMLTSSVALFFLWHVALAGWLYWRYDW